MPLFLLLFPIVLVAAFIYGCKLGNRYVGPLILFLILLPFRIVGGAFGLLTGRRTR